MRTIFGVSPVTLHCTELHADNTMPLLTHRGLFEPHPHKWGRQDGPGKLHSAHFKRDNENTRSYYTRLIGLYLDRVRGVIHHRQGTGRYTLWNEDRHAINIRVEVRPEKWDVNSIQG